MQVTRYCFTCWPEVRAKLEAEQKSNAKAWLERAQTRGFDQPQPMARPDSISWESRSWSDVSEWLALMSRYGVEADPETVAKMVAEIRLGASNMDGPMPADVTAFLQRQGG